MVNSLVPAIEAFLAIFFNLPYSILSFIYLIFAIMLIFGVIRVFLR